MQLLRDRGVEPSVVLYLDNPPSEASIAQTIERLGVEPRALLRTKEAAYQELGLEGNAHDSSQVIAALATHPVLIERPVIIRGDRAVLGRPPERVHELFSESQGPVTETLVHEPDPK